MPYNRLPRPLRDFSVLSRFDAAYIKSGIQNNITHLARDSVKGIEPNWIRLSQIEFICVQGVKYRPRAGHTLLWHMVEVDRIIRDNMTNSFHVSDPLPPKFTPVNNDGLIPRQLRDASPILEANTPALSTVESPALCVSHKEPPTPWVSVPVTDKTDDTPMNVLITSISKLVEIMSVQHQSLSQSAIEQQRHSSDQLRMLSVVIASQQSSIQATLEVLKSKTASTGSLGSIISKHFESPFSTVPPSPTTGGRHGLGYVEPLPGVETLPTREQECDSGRGTAPRDLLPITVPTSSGGQSSAKPAAKSPGKHSSKEKNSRAKKVSRVVIPNKRDKRLEGQPRLKNCDVPSMISDLVHQFPPYVDRTILENRYLAMLDDIKFVPNTKTITADAKYILQGIENALYDELASVQSTRY